MLRAFGPRNDRMGISMDIKETIRDYFAKQKDALCVYLFGSVATGKENRFSDVDIAVLFDDRASRDEYSRRVLFMMDELSILLDKNVDIVVLNEASSFLKFQIIKSGVRIYEHPDRHSRDFESAAVIEYFDYLPTRNRLEAAMISGIKGA